LITVEQSEHLDRTEGVPRGAYRRIPVNAIVDGREQIAAFTYQSDRISLGRKPSARYMGLLIEGAVHHGLPPSYLRYLEISSWLRTSDGLSRSDLKALPDSENLVRESGSAVNVKMSRVEWPLELGARPSDATRTG